MSNMVQLLAAIATDAEHMPSMLYAMRGALKGPSPLSDATWGLGYFADDHALTIQKPAELLSSGAFYELASETKSRVVLASVRPGASASPFRFRRWLFAAQGDLSSLEKIRGRILEALPDFMRSEVQRGGDSELAFAMFLRELHARGQLSDPLIDAALLRDSMRRTLDAMQMLASEAGLPGPKAAYAASNGRTVLAATSGPALHWRRQEGLEAAPDRPLDPSMAEALKRFRAVVVASDLEQPRSDWAELPTASVLSVDLQLRTQTLPPLG